MAYLFKLIKENRRKLISLYQIQVKGVGLFVIIISFDFLEEIFYLHQTNNQYTCVISILNHSNILLKHLENLYANNKQKKKFSSVLFC